MPVPAMGTGLHQDTPFESRVRGLVLGLALGDAVGSQSSDVPDEGPLLASVATQLAAWTIEGSLRGMTRGRDGLEGRESQLPTCSRPMAGSQVPRDLKLLQ